LKKRPRGRPHNTPEKLYTVYDNKTDMPVIIDGTAKECAKAMGMAFSSFYPTVRRVKIGETKKWYIEAIPTH
jgi:hypothetical protein